MQENQTLQDNKLLEQKTNEKIESLKELTLEELLEVSGGKSNIVHTGLGGNPFPWRSIL